MQGQRRNTKPAQMTSPSAFYKTPYKPSPENHLDTCENMSCILLIAGIRSSPIPWTLALILLGGGRVSPRKPTCKQGDCTMYDENDALIFEWMP